MALLCSGVVSADQQSRPHRATGPFGLLDDQHKNKIGCDRYRKRRGPVVPTWPVLEADWEITFIRTASR